MFRRHLLVPATVVGVAMTVALTGCGTPPWEGEVASSGSSTPSAAATSAAPTIRPIVNDLATGSTQRSLTAGDVSLTVDYWSTLSMDQWTPGANKPVSFSLTGTLGTDDGQQAYLSRVTVSPSVIGADGETLTAPAASTDQSSISPGYLVKAPYAYSQTFVLPPVEADATSMLLTFTYELLIQSTPTSTEYAKQTASDTLTVALAG